VGKRLPWLLLVGLHCQHRGKCTAVGLNQITADAALWRCTRKGKKVPCRSCSSGMGGLDTPAWLLLVWLSPVTQGASKA